jgi:hypothetical protein
MNSTGETSGMIYEIEPYVGVGPIRLGMTRQEVHATILEERKPTRRGDEKPGDYFPTLSLFVDYDAPGICVFVEFAWDSPLVPTFQNQVFLGQPYRVARAWFEAADPDIDTDGAGLISRRFGIALYAGSAEKEPDEPVEALSVFVKGYYARPRCLMFWRE